jgi:hypothetical protein
VAVVDDVTLRCLAQRGDSTRPLSARLALTPAKDVFFDVPAIHLLVAPILRTREKLRSGLINFTAQPVVALHSITLPPSSFSAHHMDTNTPTPASSTDEGHLVVLVHG